MIGIRREDVEDTNVTKVWPENEMPLKVFMGVGSQWRMGPSGPVALDWNVAFRLMDLMGLKPKRQLEIVNSLRTMENAALSQIKKDSST